MNNSSPEKIRFSKRPSRVRVGLDDPPPVRVPGRPHFDLKEVQRRAFERGVEKERQSTRAAVAQLTESAATALKKHQIERAADRAKVEEFAVRLALFVAERIAVAQIDAGAHDVVAMVKAALGEVKADGADGPYAVHLHPSDHAVIQEVGTVQAPGSEVTLTSDPGIARGSFLVQSGETAYWSLLGERIESMRATMLKRVEGGHAGS